MSIDLSAYPAIQTALFVRLDVEDLGVLRFSNFNIPYTIGGESYASLGSLMNVSDSTSELRLSETELTVTLSGIPTTNIDSVLDYKMKGSAVDVYRGIFNANTGANISTVGKFKGIVNNYSLQEEFPEGGKDSSVTILLTCTSIVSILMQKYSGRFTNPTDNAKWFPNDLSFDRVPNLVNSNFNFGAPKQ